MISLFFKSFTLSREEVEILTDNPQMDKAFFKVLEKLSRVNYNTRTILMEVNPQIGY
jgi:nicotinic acid phosphoribosyltransferase